MFSKGVLLSSFHLLKPIQNERISYRDFQNEKGFLYTLPVFALDFLTKGNWIIHNHVQWKLSQKSKWYSSAAFNQETLRSFLKESIMNIQPEWAVHFYKGRREFFSSLSSSREKEDLYELFQYLNLLEDTKTETIQWWDELSDFFAPSDRKQVENGRIGERLSFQYEWNRTGKKPIWESLYSNFSGYDLLSTEQNKPLKIEVKTCSSSCSFFLSKREWDEAKKSSQYLFHIWCLEPQHSLYILPVSFLQSYVPLNQSFSQWTETHFSFPSHSLSSFLVSDV
jgi:hypothetical protein